MVTDKQPRSRWLGSLLAFLLVATMLAMWQPSQSPAQESLSLGDPPVVTGDTVFLDAGDIVLAADLPTINLGARDDATAYFNTYYRGSAQPGIQWTGNHSTCDAGSTASGFREAVLLRLMYFRAMAGIPSSIGFSDSANAANQQAALMMSRNGQLSHNPSSSWLCYTTA